MNTRTALLLAAYAGGLLVVGALRYLQVHLEAPPAIAANATALYIALTVFGIVAFSRVGVPLQGLGFRAAIHPLRALGLGLAGIAVLQLSGWLLGPIWEALFGAGRNLDRFSNVDGSVAETARLLVFSWLFAAIGEEIAFRIVLMRTMAWLLGDDRRAFAIALVAQAVIFGLVHSYQGPAGIASTTVSGLVFGALVLLGRGSIWPAALAHGGNNSIGIVRLYLGA